MADIAEKAGVPNADLAAEQYCMPLMKRYDKNGMIATAHTTHYRNMYRFKRKPNRNAS